MLVICLVDIHLVYAAQVEPLVALYALKEVIPLLQRQLLAVGRILLLREVLDALRYKPRRFLTFSKASARGPV